MTSLSAKQRSQETQGVPVACFEEQTRGRCIRISVGCAADEAHVRNDGRVRRFEVKNSRRIECAMYLGVLGTDRKVVTSQRLACRSERIRG